LPRTESSADHDQRGQVIRSISPEDCRRGRDHRSWRNSSLSACKLGYPYRTRMLAVSIWITLSVAHYWVELCLYQVGRWRKLRLVSDWQPSGKKLQPNKWQRCHPPRLLPDPVAPSCTCRRGSACCSATYRPRSRSSKGCCHRRGQDFALRAEAAPEGEYVSE
jgi:hypothetical protein